MLTVLFASGVLGGPPTAGAVDTCPNAIFRTGLSANLPDCRAYELVSPPDSNGRLLGGLGAYGTPGGSQEIRSDLLSPSGDSVAFGAYMSPLPSPRGANGIVDVYEAVRGTKGWETARRLSLAGPQVRQSTFSGVSPDHLYSSNFVISGPLRVEDQSLPYIGKPDGSFELVGLGSLGSEPFAELRHIGIGGEHIVFSTGRQIEQSRWCSRAGSSCKILELEPNAPPTGTGGVYDREADGETHVVSLLPGDVTPAGGQEAFWKGTSKSGIATAFEIEGALYVRMNNEETLEVASGDPLFAGLSDDGRYVFYIQGGSGEAGNIHRFDTTTEADVEVNSSGDGEIVNVSGDGSHVYFISSSQLDGGKGTVGQPNLYVWSGPSPEYITTVAPSDLERTSGELQGIPALANWTGWVANLPSNGFEQGPGNAASRATPDGDAMIFESRAQLTDYDNDGHTEIYRWDDDAQTLTCVSCNPLAEPASKDARLQELTQAIPPTVIHNLTEDGRRVFFETSEALAEGDTDGINDIYEWQEGEGGGSSLALISSGHSIDFPVGLSTISIPVPNILLAVGPDGEDVVFRSQDALVPGAPQGGAVQIYDARVNGGLPPPNEPVPCNEEGCRPAATAPPSFAAPGSEAIEGAGNLRPSRHHRKHRRCRRPPQRKRGCAKHVRSRQRQARLSSLAGAAEPAGGQPSGQTILASAGQTAGSPPEQDSSAAVGPVAAAGPGDEYGIEAVSAGESTSAAGMHPDFTNKITFNHTETSSGPELSERTEEVTVTLPPGLLGNPSAIPRCKTGELVAVSCPVSSQVGMAKIRTTFLSGAFVEPLYNLAPPHPDQEIARLGFTAAFFPVFIDVRVRSASDYGVTATVYGASALVSLVSAETTLWGNPADPVHDKERMLPAEFCPSYTACKAPGGKRESGLPPTAFFSNPSACQPMSLGFRATSYQQPDQPFEATAPMEPIGDCEGLPFDPSLEARPSTDVAGAPTGLETSLELPQSTDPEIPSTAAIREARVTLPEGMAINPGAADGLAACSDAQVRFHEEADAQCPDAAKIGTATISAPPLPRPIEGALYQRSPGGKGDRFGLWLVSDDLGLHIKIPGQVKPDPQTGQLTAVFTDLPQVPVEEIDFDIWGGARAPLKNPDACGIYETTSTFTPWSDDPPVTVSDHYQIDHAPDGGPCSSEAAQAPNSPAFQAGTIQPLAATYSPFVLKLHREDGSQQFGALDLTLPPGLLGKLAGLAQCGDSALSAAADRTGAEELAGPSCPPGSLIGAAWAAAGAGPAPYWTRGNAYLAGPYEGAPLSVAIVTPAVAGPFDLGTVVVRSGLFLDPESGRITVKSDPIPRILEGVPLNLRTIAVSLDRDRFTLNGTSCEPLAFSGALISTLGSPAPLSDRFQLAECSALGFRPKLSLALRGPTRRGANPALEATLVARGGDANIARTRVTLPRAAFLDNSHFARICTRVQFAADQCPRRSVYGHAWATTPLLDYRLEGDVYLRSSDHLLPDLVIKLRGPDSQPLEFDLVGRTDSAHGALRNTFETVPDAPVDEFHLELFGGRRGLIELSSGLCRRPRAVVKMDGQNGRIHDTNPVVKARCGRRKR